MLELRDGASDVSTLNPRLIAILLLPPLMWAGNAVVGRAMVGSVSPAMLNFLRWAIALAILLPLGWQAVSSASARAQIRARWPALALLGLLGVGSYNLLLYIALVTSSPVNVTLIAASLPLFMLGIGVVFYRAPVTAKALIGALLSMAGVLVVMSRGDAAQLAALRLVPGDLLMLLAVACWAAYSWMLARPPPSLAIAQRPSSWGWAEFLLVQTLFGVLWAGAAATTEAVVAPSAIAWSPAVILALLYIAVGPSLVAYRCWGLGVAEGGPAMAGFFANLTPVFAAILQTVLIGEAPRAFHALAFTLIVAGIAVSSRR